MKPRLANSPQIVRVEWITVAVTFITAVAGYLYLLM